MSRRRHLLPSSIALCIVFPNLRCFSVFQKPVCASREVSSKCPYEGGAVYARGYCRSVSATRVPRRYSPLGDGNVGLETGVALLLVAAVGLLIRNDKDENGRDTGVARAGNFRYFVDRCEINFNNAFYALAAAHRDFDGDALFTYYDSYVAEKRPEDSFKQVPELSGWKRHVRLLDRSVTDEFDDKRTFASKLQATGCDKAFASSFQTADEAFNATADQPDALFFIKEPLESGGKGMRIVRREQLHDSTPSSPHLIELAVQDIRLIEGRKFTVRFYILIHDRALYLHKRGLVVVHVLPYRSDSTDYDVQVCNDAMHDTPNGSAAALCAWDTLPDGPAWYAAIAARIREIEPALRPLLDASSADTYTIIGGDALIEQSGQARLIELNFYPNLGSHNASINTQVKQPVLRDVLAKVLVQESPPDFELLFARH